MSDPSTSVSSWTTSAIEGLLQDAITGEDPAKIFGDVLQDIFDLTDPGESTASQIAEILSLTKEILDDINELSTETYWVTIASELQTNGEIIKQYGETLSSLATTVAAEKNGVTTDEQNAAKTLAEGMYESQNVAIALGIVQAYMEGSEGLPAAYAVYMKGMIEALNDDPTSTGIVQIYKKAQTFQNNMAAMQLQGLSLAINATLQQVPGTDVTDVIKTALASLKTQSAIVTANTPSFMPFAADTKEGHLIPTTLRNATAGDEVFSQDGEVPFSGNLAFGMDPLKSPTPDNQILNVQWRYNATTFWFWMTAQDRNCIIFADGSDVYLDATSKEPKYHEADSVAQWRIIPLTESQDTAYYLRNEDAGDYMILDATPCLDSDRDNSTAGWTFHAP